MTIKKGMQRKTRKSIAGIIASAVVSLGIAPAPYSSVVQACAFDFTKPERTAVDWILEAETLVLARPDPQNKFAYKVVEVLRGDSGNYDVPLLVDTRNRRFLERNTDHTVMLRADDTGQWAHVAYVDDDFSVVLETVLANADVWAKTYVQSRFAVFEALQGSESPALRELSVRELDKAPYKMLQSLELRIPVEDLLADLWTPTGYSYQPIRVLMLGLSDDVRARAEVYDYFERARTWAWADNIGAFAAALVELDGISGVTYLDEKLLSDPGQPIDKLQGVIGALAVHRSVANADLAREIDQTLAQLVSMRPETAPLVARHFAAQSDWSQAGPLAKLVQERRLMTMADLMAVSVYVAQARGATLPQTPIAEEG
ncbi:MAG: hypothetical protein WBV71_01435 [Roseobacter sp.]